MNIEHYELDPTDEDTASTTGSDDADDSTYDIYALWRMSVKELRELCRARGVDAVVKRGQKAKETLAARLAP